ncbi:MAG: type I restriction endonuclease subunit R, partial [Phaeodactylibacter sp.]|nr:type I restriction endonuclease subunit R [Phaeodactylibacter sp.]
IVRDMWLTGFDAPSLHTMYVDKPMKGHNLMQAIARVNRVAKGKDYGQIIDYYGVLQELDEAIKTYSSFEDFEAADLEHTFSNVQEELKKLPQLHVELWDLFIPIQNKYDEPAYEELLRDEAIRRDFYDRLSAYARLLKLALSVLKWNQETPAPEIKRYKYDLGFFAKLRAAVRNIYTDSVDFKAYEKQIQQLIDKHVTTHEVQPITELVNIFETEKFEQEVEKIVGTAAKADMMASRTDRHINEKMEEDPAFYKKFADLLKETIQAYRERRITEAEYLKRVTSIKDNVLHRTGGDLPKALEARPVAAAFYGVARELFQAKMQDEALNREIATFAGLGIDELVQAYVLDEGSAKVDWKNKSDLIGQLEIAIGDFLMDELRDKYDLRLSFGEINQLTERLLDIAEKQYR